MKKSWKALGLAAVLAWSATACVGEGGGGKTVGHSGGEDLACVQEKGTLVVGVTEFAPMDYRKDGVWIGFDAELAAEFAGSLGVTVQFKEIKWDQKIPLLEDGTIDCIWNGMTGTEELQETISCSEPYLSNAQVVVLRADEAKQYQTPEECQHLLFTAESGSTGEAVLKDRNYRYFASGSQKEALQNVLDEKADAAVIDIVMAGFYTGDGQEFEKLKFLSEPLNDEIICVGFRRESDLTQKLNDFLDSAGADGSLKALAEKYGIEGALLEQ